MSACSGCRRLRDTRSEGGVATTDADSHADRDARVHAAGGSDDEPLVITYPGVTGLLSANPITRTGFVRAMTSDDRNIYWVEEDEQRSVMGIPLTASDASYDPEAEHDTTVDAAVVIATGQRAVGPVVADQARIFFVVNRGEGPFAHELRSVSKDGGAVTKVTLCGQGLDALAADQSPDHDLYVQRTYRGTLPIGQKNPPVVMKKDGGKEERAPFPEQHIDDVVVDGDDVFAGGFTVSVAQKPHDGGAFVGRELAQEECRHIAADREWIYCVTDSPRSIKSLEQGKSPFRVYVSRIPRTGGAVVPLCNVELRDLKGDAPHVARSVTSIGVDDRDVYFSADRWELGRRLDGIIVRCPKNGGGPADLLAISRIGIPGLVLDGESVIWAVASDRKKGGAIVRAAKAGHHPHPLE